jgi:hypothetical protein
VGAQGGKLRRHSAMLPESRDWISSVELNPRPVHARGRPLRGFPRLLSS